MTLRDLERVLGCRAWGPYTDVEVTTAYTSDLLSDVMAHAPEGGLLITLQGHKNTVACASLAGLGAIVLAGTTPAEDMVEAATQEGIALFSSPLRQFDLSWRVAQLLGLTDTGPQSSPTSRR